MTRSVVARNSTTQAFRGRLLAWYDGNKRDLPWRRNRDPYRVWLSEIMLQQTRVAAVVDHYRRFLQKFPNVKRLATAPESSVLSVWSGLGYYRRARMLHAAAREIVKQHGGEFPGTSEQWRTLPGIGRYTAAAIASIAFDEPVAVVDGNVQRVLQRLLGTELAGEKLWTVAQRLLEPRRPGDFNQAMMELGATICLPHEPSCLLCPLVDLCVTRGQLKRRASKGRQRKREVYFSLDRRKNSVLLVRRPEDASLMPGMWELPEATAADHGETWLTLRHSITVTDYVVGVKLGAPAEGTAGKWVAKRRLNHLPLTGLARKILRAAEIL